MATATRCILNGKGISILKALELRKKNSSLNFKCIECGGPVRPHSGGGHTKAHFEHLRRNSKCSLSHNSELYNYTSTNSSQSEELEKIYQTIRNRSNDFKENGRKWLREIASAKNFIATPELTHWTFGKSANINNKYHTAGGTAKNWLYKKGFRNVLELSDNKFKQTVIRCFKVWATDITITDIIGKFERDQQNNGRFELLVHESIISTGEFNFNAGLVSEFDNNTLVGQDAYYVRKQRTNQGVFRQRMIKYWGKCCVTGITNTKFLIASHIKPWHKCSPKEKVSRDNGLLLIASYDFLFDNFYLTFSDEGRGILSNTGKLVSKYFGISGRIQINRNLSAKQKEYLKLHRKEFDKRSATN